MTFKRYTEEFRAEAVRQVTNRGYSVGEVAERLGVSSKSLYKWIRDEDTPQENKDAQAEIVRLKRELKRAQEERDILKEAAAYFASESKRGTRS
jgi:transposase